MLAATTVDAAAVKKRVETDAFGRIAAVREYNGTQVLVTSYSYDVLNNLTQVTQTDPDTSMTQMRTFTYDSLSRLVQSQQPENGVVKYVYDKNGNLKERWDGRSAAQATLAVDYDSLNRAIRRSSPALAAATPEVVLEYDSDLKPSTVAAVNYPKGQLTRVRVGGAGVDTNQYTFELFDAQGRVLRGTQKVDAASYTFVQEFDAAGQLKAVEHPAPAARRIVYAYNALGQVTSVVDGNGKVYASGLEYAPHGAMTKVVLGNGLTERMTPNVRLQPEKIELGNTVADDVGSMAFGYAGATCQGTGWANNGNVVSQVIKVGATTTITQQYGYL